MARSNPFVDGVLRVVRDVATRALRRASDPSDRTARRPTANLKPRNRETRKPERSNRTDRNSVGYPGDYPQRPHIVYQPIRDGRPDPGEIVWTWVPYEEDSSKGKDRPVLLIGMDGEWLLGLQVTSKDNDRDAHEARAGRFWMDIGSGAWDNQGRPSEVRVNRIIRIDPDAVRRVGAILDEDLFNQVADEVLHHY